MTLQSALNISPSLQQIHLCSLWLTWQLFPRTGTDTVHLTLIILGAILTLVLFPLLGVDLSNIVKAVRPPASENGQRQKHQILLVRAQIGAEDQGYLILIEVPGQLLPHFYGSSSSSSSLLFCKYKKNSKSCLAVFREEQPQVAPSRVQGGCGPFQSWNVSKHLNFVKLKLSKI